MKAKMKKIALTILFTVSAALVQDATAQSRMSGSVVEVTDGKTVVIDVSGRRLTAELQFIEVPEPDQVLYKIVREHLEKLTLGKQVVFHPHGFAPGKAIGQLFVNSADVSIQMLRDGAAWHIDPAKSGQKADESAAYAFHENQAKAESRGVWAVKDLKPAWEHRAAKLEAEKQAKVAAEQGSTKTSESNEVPVSTKPRTRGNGIWSDVNPWLKDPGPLVNGYNAATKTGYVGTSLMGVKEQEGAPADNKTAIDITYIYKQDEDARKGVFVFTVISSSNNWRFLKANNLTVIVDERKFPIGVPKRTTSTEDGRVSERLTYEVGKATIEKIVHGGEVFIKIGDYMMYPTHGMQLLLYNMLQVAN